MTLMLTHVVEGNKTVTVRFEGSVSPRLGRDPGSNDIILHDPGVSRAHATMEPSGSGYLITDLGSKKGTFVNGGKVDGKIAVNTGDIIEIGPFVLLVDLGVVQQPDMHNSEKTFRLELQRCPNEKCNAYVLDEFETCMTCGTVLRTETVG